MTHHVISVERLCKRFDLRGRTIDAVRDVSFQVTAGEAFGFIGPNGSGKSTTIKMLIGTLSCTSGTARLMGKPVEQQEARRGMSYVPENPYLYDYLTPLEILGMGVAMHRLELPDVRAHCMYWLERFGIAPAARRRIRSFSKGMVQRTALAHALACQPKLLILDEPLSGLDPIGRKEVVDILVEYRRNGGTVFFSSHVLHDVERLADRFGLIHQGALRTIQHPREMARYGQITVMSEGENTVVGMQAEFGQRWRGTVSQADLWPLLTALQAGKHTLIEIKPAMDLEAIFLDIVGHSPRSADVQ